MTEKTLITMWILWPTDLPTMTNKILVQGGNTAIWHEFLQENMGSLTGNLLINQS